MRVLTPEPTFVIFLGLSLILHVSGFYFLLRNPEKVTIHALPQPAGVLMIMPNHSVKDTTLKKNSVTKTNSLQKTDMKNIKYRDVDINNIENTETIRDVSSERSASESLAETIGIHGKNFKFYQRDSSVDEQSKILLYPSKFNDWLYLFKDEMESVTFRLLIDKTGKVVDIKIENGRLSDALLALIKNNLYMYKEESEVEYLVTMNPEDYYEKVCLIDIDADIACSEYLRQRDAYFNTLESSASLGIVPR